jgi:hypothetical protein
MAVVSFLFSELDEVPEQHLPVLTHLLTHPSLYSPQDIQYTLNTILKFYINSSPTNHEIFWELFSIILQSQSLHLFNLSSFLVIIEKLPFYIQTLMKNYSIKTINNCLHCLQIIFGNEYEMMNFSLKIDTIMTKLLNITMKLLKSFVSSSQSPIAEQESEEKAREESSPQDCLLALKLFLIFYSSRGRAIHNSFGNAINNICHDLVLLRAQQQLLDLGSLGEEIRQTAARLLAVNVSFSSVELYEAMWLTITEGLASPYLCLPPHSEITDCASTLTLLGLLESSQYPQTKSVVSRLDLINASLTTLRIPPGANRGIHLEMIFNGTLLLLSEVLQNPFPAL